jgi:hypothetical protein
MIKCLVASANETTPFNNTMSVVKCRSCEILVVWMNFKSFKRVDWSNSMLPYVTYNIVEALNLKHIDWVRRQPVLQVNVANLSHFPVLKVLFK